MKVSFILKLIIASFLVIAVSFVILAISNNNERAAVSTQAAYKQLGLDLSDASDFLTNQARAYVQYGEQKYYNDYMNEVEVTKTREHVVAELTRLGAPENELALVEKASELSNTLAQLETLAFEAVERGDLETARQLMFGADYENGKAPIVKTMQEFQSVMNSRTSEAAESAKTRADMMLIVFSVLFIATAVVVTTALVSINNKMKMIEKLADCASQIALGDTDIIIDMKSKDEIGVLADSFKTMLDAIRQQVMIVQKVAEGDLTAEIALRSNKDVMGAALEKTVISLNKMFGEINASTAQVSTGSKQIADGAQALAQGSTEQASAVEQLSNSITEIAQKTKHNAERADKAAALANTIMSNAEKGSRQMGEMMSAVKEINEASQSINKVIKVIDDIAFQTNILALNAAVEAARAGQHGKGFAVVAEEVRNLAAKSAEAAKDTEGLIFNSMEKAELGARIADETASSLKEIVSGVNESTQLVNDIAKSSDEQSAGISQINTGIDQVAQVIQQNSATAEESAAASEEMSGQADMLQSLVAQFRLKDEGAERFQNLSSTGKNAHGLLTIPDNCGMAIDHGKY